MKPAGIWERFRRWICEDQQEVQDKAEENSIETVSRAQVQEALKAWKDAENYFAHVDEPDLVEYAAYSVQTARRRYLCLLHRAQ